MNSKCDRTALKNPPDKAIKQGRLTVDRDGCYKNRRCRISIRHVGCRTNDFAAIISVVFATPTGLSGPITHIDVVR